ncbi:hypothetical protein D9757_010219 [Collybiopsis confluens]|uniref:Protein kinase domain-containing protein n=1 Tax=Collybiopsis confluens TaxID=2823264 RepID=A0A8H5GQ13_9AGAR|nr:hypothetical protein D9757_010219 [Collybiopsis confluens]
MSSIPIAFPPSPPRPPAIKYEAPHGTRWDKEKAAAGGAHAFELASDPKVIGPWIIGECVGKGASGRVKIAKHRYTNQLAAVKILPRAPLDTSRNSIATQEAKNKKHSLGIEREITMMKLMNHPNILRIYDVYESSRELYLVLEFVEGGELFDYLVNRGKLPEPDAICFFKQIIYGLNYAHTFSIIHRDLKPENILISSLSPPRIKIVDWGMAAFAPPSLQLETSCGSPHYASPEIVNGHKYTGNATDIWSCGVILYALLTGRLPFDHKDVKALLGKVKAGKYEMPSNIDPSAQDLISKMLVIDSTERITIPEILAHPWLNTSPAARRHLSLEFPPDPVLPPSPSTLSRPISDPTGIDPDILFSLKIIWGRHANSDAILNDLGSPAGNGVHTKAFYWLLRRHHEEAEKLASSDELNADNSAGTDMGQGSVTFNLGWELDTSGLGRQVLNNSVATRAMGSCIVPDHLRLSLSDGHHGDSNRGPTSGLLPPLMTRNSNSATVTSSSRGRPSSPRLPNVPRPSYERNSYVNQNQACPSAGSTSGRSSSQPPRSSFAINNAGRSGIRVVGSVINGGHGGPRPQPPKRGQTYSHPRSDKYSHAPTPSVANTRSGSLTTVSTVQFPAESLAQDTQPHRSASSSRPLPSRARSATTPQEVGMKGGLSVQSRPHSRTSQTRGYSGEALLERIDSSAGCSSSSSTACGASSASTLHTPVPLRAVSGGSTVAATIPMDVDDVPPSSVSPSTSTPPLLPPFEPLPLLTAPKLDDPVLQSELDSLAEHVNRISLQDPAVETYRSRGDLRARLTEPLPLPQQQQRQRPSQARQTSYQQQRFQSPKRTNRRRTVSTVEHGARKGGDKENNRELNVKVADESWSYIAADEGSNVVGVNGKAPLLLANAGNIKPTFGAVSGIGDGSAGGGKGKKEKEGKRPRPPPLEFLPPSRKRSTISNALGSPIALSPLINGGSSTKEGLRSPVVGEFKGWLSNLFSWSGKISGNSIMYSTDDVGKTRRDLVQLFSSLGVVVEAMSAEPGVDRHQCQPLHCRVEEWSMDAVAHLGMKPVKFRIELVAIGDEAGAGGLLPTSPVTPSLGGPQHLFAATTTAAPGSRGRSSTLGAIDPNSPQILLSPLPSPNNFLPLPGHGYKSAMIVIQEKGSTSTFKAIWKKLKDVYDCGYAESSTGYSNFSPVMTSTPFIEPPRCVA